MIFFEGIFIRFFNIYGQKHFGILSELTSSGDNFKTLLGPVKNRPWWPLNGELETAAAETVDDFTEFWGNNVL